MPDSYAHLRFGAQVLAAAPPQLKQAIFHNKRFFDIGLYGPDPFFFYRPMFRTETRNIAKQTHRKTGREFFTHGARVIEQSQDPQAAAAYLYGVLCHFALDSGCHGYVNREAGRKASHTAMETSFDRCLMLKDGLDPLEYNPVAPIQATREIAGILAPFYPGVSEKQMMESLRAMLWNSKLLTGKRQPKRLIQDAVSHLANDSFGGMIMTRQRDPRCRESDDQLWLLYRVAVTNGRVLMLELEALLDGRGTLGKGFDVTFEGE